MNRRETTKRNLIRYASDPSYVWNESVDISGTLGAGFVLYGAGNIGERTILRLRGSSYRLLDIADRFRGGEKIFGMAVLSPEELLTKYGRDIPIIVSIWQGGSSTVRFSGIRDDLYQWGFTNVRSILDLYWSDPERFLPYLICDEPQKTLIKIEEILTALELFDDDDSLEIMQNHVQFRLSGDFDLLRRSPGVEYFDSFTSSATPIRLLDCGAFDGDTIRSALREEVKLEEIVAIEPDPDNHRKLKQWAAISEISDRIRVVEAAVASFPGLLNFSSNGDMTSSLAITDNRESVRKVRVVTIDQLCRELDWKPTHIKMDIEGAEKEALLGAATILKSLRPNLMISLEHAYDDLWSIPLLVNQLVNGYEFRIRHYSESGFDAVLYARPARD